MKTADAVVVVMKSLCCSPPWSSTAVGGVRWSRGCRGRNARVVGEAGERDGRSAGTAAGRSGAVPPGACMYKEGRCPTGKLVTGNETWRKEHSSREFMIEYRFNDKPAESKE